MHGSTTENGITPENNGTIPKTLPTPTPRNITQKDDEVTDSLPLEEASDDKEVDPIYATIGPKTQSLSKETVFEEAWDREETEKNISEQLSQLSNGSGTPPPTFPPSPEVATSTISSVLTGVAPPKPPRTGTPSTAGSTTSRSGSVVSNSSLEESTSGEGGGSTPTTPPPSYTSEDGSEKSLLSDGKKTNRFLQKVKYVMQKKKVVMPFAGLVTVCCTMAIALSVQQKGFVGFIGSVNPVTIFGGVLASCLVLGIMWELIQAVRTEEHKITKRDTQKVLDDILDTLPKDKCIKSLVLKYSNGNRVYFTFHSLQGQEKGNANIVELIGQPICYKSRVNSLINDRLWLPILGTVLITGSITFPLTLYSTVGLSNIINLYTNPNIYLPVAAISGALLLLTVACAINHWSKTDFKDYLLLRKQDASNEELNGTSIATVKESQKEINSKLLQVVAEPCGHPDITYIIN